MPRGRPSKPEPTGSQKQLYVYLLKYISENGYQPSQAEMAEHFHITQASIQDQLRGLEKRGFLVMSGVERAIQIPDVRFGVQKRKRA
jgi:SOS-response transcriptional repressor LexA